MKPQETKAVSDPAAVKLSLAQKIVMEWVKREVLFPLQ